MSSVSQGSMLGRIVLNIFTNDINNRTECSVDGTKLCGAVSSLEGRE